MWTIGLLLSRMLILRFAMIVFGVTAFVLSLDIVTYAEDILALHDNDLSTIGTYAVLRAPSIMSSFMSLSILLATLMLLTEISHHSELVAIWGAGISPLRMIFMLAPLAAILGLVQFLLNDVAIPAAAPILHEWAVGEYSDGRIRVGEDDPIWMRSGNDILRATGSNASATSLEDVIIFRRDSDGLLIEQLMADTAELVDGRWELADVAIYYRENVQPSQVTRLIYSGLMRPAAVGLRSGDPEEMSIRELSFFVENAGFGIRPPHVYATWFHKRITFLLIGFLMIMIAVPLAGRYRRGGGLGLLFAAGIGLGFAFFVLDGIAMTLGELGLLPAWMAAWMPVMVFSLAASTIAFRHETL